MFQHYEKTSEKIKVKRSNLAKQTRKNGFADAFVNKGSKRW
jgi:ribosomal protein S21